MTLSINACQGQVNAARLSKVSNLVHLGQVLADRVKPGLSLESRCVNQ
jgi:hypothetical protein